MKHLDICDRTTSCLIWDTATTERYFASLCLARDFAHSAEERSHGQVLHKDRKCSDSKTDRNDLFTH